MVLGPRSETHIFIGYYFTFLPTQSFVTCPLGIWMVGYTTLPFGILMTISGFFGGFLAKRLDRITVLTIGKSHKHEFVKHKLN